MMICAHCNVDLSHPVTSDVAVLYGCEEQFLAIKNVPPDSESEFGSPNQIRAGHLRNFRHERYFEIGDSGV